MKKADAKRLAELALRDAVMEVAANIGYLDLREGRRDAYEPKCYLEAGGAVYCITVEQIREPGWRSRQRPPRRTKGSMAPGNEEE